MTPLQSVVNRCIAKKQWAHIAAMEGRSEHDVRCSYDLYYMTERPKVQSSSVAMPSQSQRRVEWAKRAREILRKHGVQQGQFAAMIGVSAPSISNAFNPTQVLTSDMRRAIDKGIERIITSGLPEPEPRPGITPAPRKWVVRIRGRMSRLGMSVADLAKLIGTSRTSLSAMLAPTGHVSTNIKDKIELALKCAEKPFHAERARQVEGRAA